jgi:hypothetical protein
MTTPTGAAELPEALRHASYLDGFFVGEEVSAFRARQIAAELRRLHHENERLAVLVEAQQPAPSAEKYDDTLLPFLALMRKELHANADKGDRPGWLKMSADQALLEIYWHTAKLSAAVKNGDGPAIIEHSADVANMAMMLLDVCGGIPTPQAAPSVLEDWRLDHSAGRPILVYKDCSVIEAEQAQEVLDALRASHGQAPAGVLEDAARLDWIAVHGSFGMDSVSGELGGNGQRRLAATRSNIDAARKQGANHD